MAQRDSQLWIEHQLSYPFANRYLLENTTTYQTLLNKDRKWESVSISPTFEYTLTRRWDLLSEVPIGYTRQKDGVTSWDIMPMVGARYYVSQNRKIDVRILFRYQLRYFRQIEAENWEISNRTRLRGEIYWSINGPNLFTDKLWYLFADYEEFIVLDQQVHERYAYRRRARVGIGYRFNYMHRLDLSYTLQSSRKEIDGSFVSDDNVIQLKYKMFLHSAATQVPSK